MRYRVGGITVGYPGDGYANVADQALDITAGAALVRFVSP
jgi:hypothetical protein